MKQYTVTGMSCAACSARVEKAVSQVPGVTACSVSLLTNSMGVEGTASAAGHHRGGARMRATARRDKGAGGETQSPQLHGRSEAALEDHETPVLQAPAHLVAWAFCIVLMYFSMGHMMWGWPLPALLVTATMWPWG